MKRAADARAVAADMVNPRAKAGMMIVAGAYEAFARNATQRLKAAPKAREASRRRQEARSLHPVY